MASVLKPTTLELNTLTTANDELVRDILYIGYLQLILIGNTHRTNKKHVYQCSQH